MNSRCSALELAPWANRGGLLDAGLPREAVLPALNHGFGHARLTHDRVRPEPIDAPQHDAGARRTNAGYFGPQRRFRADGKLRSKARKRCHCASRQTLGGRTAKRNPKRTQPSELIYKARRHHSIQSQTHERCGQLPQTDRLLFFSRPNVRRISHWGSCCQRISC